MLTIRYPCNQFILNMGIPIFGKVVFILKHGPGHTDRMYSANMVASKGEPIFAQVNMHGLRWKFMAPSSSLARNSAMKSAERSSLKILPSPTTSSIYKVRIAVVYIF